MVTAHEQATDAAESDPTTRFLERLASRIGGHAKVQAVFGEPVERDGVTVIPVARVRWGVGGGGGEGPEGSGSGGGGGVTAEPVGYIEITASGATFRPMPRSFSPAQAVGAAVAAAIVLRALARFRR
jgi:uncharacterized spore protein YtfJ